MVFYLGWTQGFPRKNCVFTIYFFPQYFAYCYVQKQPVRTGVPTVCEKLAKAFKNTIHSPSCVLVLINSTSGIKASSLQRLHILRDPKDEYSTRYAWRTIHNSSTLLQRPTLWMVEESNGKLHTSWGLWVMDAYQEWTTPVSYTHLTLPTKRIV